MKTAPSSKGKDQWPPLREIRLPQPMVMEKACLTGVEAEAGIHIEGVDGIGIVPLRAQSEAGSGGGNAGGGDSVLVIEHDAGAQAKAVVGEGIEIEGDAGGGEVELAADADAGGAVVAVDGDVVDGVSEVVADAADVEVAVGIDGGLHVDAADADAAGETQAREGRGADAPGRRDGFRCPGGLAGRSMENGDAP